MSTKPKLVLLLVLVAVVSVAISGGVDPLEVEVDEYLRTNPLHSFTPYAVRVRRGNATPTDG
mgnify:CR=1 FL=1